jgi:hypothetical protein
MSDDDNITQLPVKHRKPVIDPGASLQMVHSYDCQHGNFLVDEKMGEVECGRCKAKLNPIWVLMQIAIEDRVLRDQWASLKAEIELMKPRLKTRCDHCGKLTKIPANVKTWDVQQRANDILRRSKP